jgi:hypothetical protein
VRLQQLRVRQRLPPRRHFCVRGLDRGKAQRVVLGEQVSHDSPVLAASLARRVRVWGEKADGGGVRVCVCVRCVCVCVCLCVCGGGVGWGGGGGGVRLSHAQFLFNVLMPRTKREGRNAQSRVGRAKGRFLSMLAIRREARVREGMLGLSHELFPLHEQRGWNLPVSCGWEEQWQ